MKASGRALSDFFKDGTFVLPEPEQRLLAAVRHGAVCHFPGSDASFPESADDITIRAPFLRFLLLGGDENAPIHEAGIKLRGAFVKGLIDLDECEVKFSFRMERCTLDGGLCLSDASMKSILLLGCKVNAFSRGDAANINTDAAISIFAERVTASGTFGILDGSNVAAQICMGSARIGGSLYLRACSFQEDKGVSVKLSGARIGGNLCLGLAPRFSHLAAGEDDPIMPKSLFQGRVLLKKATITGDFFCAGSIIRAPGPSAQAALNCQEMIVQGTFYLVQAELIEGVSLVDATIGTLWDDLKVWMTGAGKHRYSGFVYNHIADDSRSLDRRAWLEMQRPEDLARIKKVSRSGLRRQPWQQAAKALEGGGDIDGAKRIRIALERRATRGTPWRWLLHLPYDLICQYGYSPRRLFIITAAVWLCGAVVFNVVAKAGQFVATDSAVLKSSSYLSCHSKTGMNGNFFSGYCSQLVEPDYSGVYPWLYSADNLIPLIDLGQRKAWRLKTEVKPPVFWFLTAQYVFGFMVGSALVATMGSIVVRKAA